MRNDKYLRVKKASRIGTFGDTFQRNLDCIPEEIIKKINAQDLGKLVDVIQKTYEAGKQAGREHMIRNPEEAKIMLGK